MSVSLLEKYLKFKQQMDKKGIPFMITSIDRTIIEQMALYTQGRMSLADVNKFRAAAEMYPLPASENSRVVTWTLNSAHVTNLMDGTPTNDYSRAFDIAILKEGKPTWDLKISVNEDELPDYMEAANIWRELGGTAGMFWDRPDPAHFQI